MSEETARAAATEQMAKDPIGIHAKMHLGIDIEELTNPWTAGIASLIAFTIGGLIPLATMLLSGPDWRIPATFLGVMVALAASGTTSARLAHSPYLRALARNILGGVLAMAITFGIGSLVGTTL